MDKPTLAITVYGATNCDDTARTRALLDRLGIDYRYVNIDHDAEAERFVVFVNEGSRSTPTLVVGAGRKRMLLTEPTDEELRTLVGDALRGS